MSTVEMITSERHVIWDSNKNWYHIAILILIKYIDIHNLCTLYYTFSVDNKLKKTVTLDQMYGGRCKSNFF